MLRRFFPILQWLPSYKKAYLTGDITAGVTVGILLIPQGLAYAMIAGLPPIYGLYTALVPQLAYAIFGTSRQLAVGPVAMDSLLVAAGLGALSLAGPEEYIAMAVLLALFVGVIQLTLGLFRMGFLVNFLSRPVISGFTSAAALLIGLSQLKYLMGVDIAGSNQVHILLFNLLKAIPGTHWITLSIAIAATGIILYFRKAGWKFPASVTVVVLGVLGVYFFRLDTLGVRIVGEVPGGLPSFGLPTIQGGSIAALFSTALAIAVIAFMEAVSIAKAMEDRHRDYKVDASQELVALGMSNIVGSLFHSYPATGGFARTAVNDQAGAKTGVAALISAAMVALTLLFLTPLFQYLPTAILGAIILVAVSGLIDLKYPVELYRDRKDEFLLLLATFLITLIFGIKDGILLGVLLSLLLLVYRISRPHIAVLGKIKGTPYFRNIDRFRADIETDESVLLIRFDGQLFFGNQAYFWEEIHRQMASKGPALKYLILNAEGISYADSSAVYLLRQLILDLKERGVTLMIASAIGPVRDILYSSGLMQEIGKENLFVSTSEAYARCTAPGFERGAEARIASQTNKTSM